MDNFGIFYDNITELEFNWILEEGWEEQEKFFFRDARCGKSLPVHKMTSSLSSSRENSPKVGRWILRDKNSKYLGWAECYVDLRKFLISKVSVEIETKQISLGVAERALSRLISSILISSNTDLVKLNCLCQDLQNHMIDDKWGELNRVWVPNINFDVLTADVPLGNELLLFSITPETWFSSERGIADKESLNYLTLKKERISRRSRPTMPRKSSRGVVGNLFKGIRI